MAKQFKDLEDEYNKLFKSISIRSSYLDELESVSFRIQKSKPVYERIGLKLNIPWYLIACIHFREASLDFSKNIANGEPWNRKTRLVPAGRGPFESFEEAAIDALIYDGLHKVKDWSIARVLYEAECYNGMGYRNKHPDVLSPYLWCGSHHYTSGGYYSDGRFSHSYVNKSLGVAVIIKYLIDCAVIADPHKEQDTESKPQQPVELKPEPSQDEKPTTEPNSPSKNQGVGQSSFGSLVRRFSRWLTNLFR